MMDAKPQRPARSLKVFDENALPGAGLQKTIHHRNKSSPALSTMSQAGGLRQAAKRTAFGDLSNTTNHLRPSKDDSVLAFKNDHAYKENLPPIIDKKAAALQKPAQRPITIGTLRSFLNNGSNTAASSVNHIHPENYSKENVKNKNNNLPQSGPLQQILQGNALPPYLQQQSSLQPLQTLINQSLPTLSNISKKVVSKKASTIVFRDDQHAPQIPATLTSIDEVSQDPSTSRAPIPPVHRELSAKPVSVSSNLEPVAHAQSQTVREDKLSFGIETRPTGTRTNALLPHSEAPSLSMSDGIYIDDQGEVQVYDYTNFVDYDGGVDGILPKSVYTDLDENYHASKVPLADHDAVSYSHNSYAEQTRKHKLPPVSEPEEYWEEEEAIENYEEGYVTARSFKSRGESTTGGATTVLFPKDTQKSKREIALAQELVEAARTREELEDEAWDTTMVAEYGDDIFAYMKHLEIKMLPNAHYMDNQAEIQWSMRAVLMDWIVQVHHRFNLLPETLFLTVNYIDRFLSCKVVSLGKLQLVGATAIFIAAKYEEIDCPSVSEIVYMVDGGYTVDEVLKAERFMLTMLSFELGWPGPMSFLRRISKADDYDLETRTLAKYFLELTIMDERFVGSPPSFVAAGAHCLARMMLRKGNWSTAHVCYSNYTYSQLYNLVALMVECCEEARKHHCAIYDKYTDKRYKRASSFVELEMKKGFQPLPVLSSVETSSPSTPYASYAQPYESASSELWCKA